MDDVHMGDTSNVDYVCRGRVIGAFFSDSDPDHCMLDYQPFDSVMATFAMVEIPVIEALLRSIGSTQPDDLTGRIIEISYSPREGALPFHVFGCYLRLVPPEHTETAPEQAVAR